MTPLKRRPHLRRNSHVHSELLFAPSSRNTSRQEPPSHSPACILSNGTFHSSCRHHDTSNIPLRLHPPTTVSAHGRFRAVSPLAAQRRLGCVQQAQGNVYPPALALLSFLSVISDLLPSFHTSHLAFLFTHLSPHTSLILNSFFSPLTFLLSSLNSHLLP